MAQVKTLILIRHAHRNLDEPSKDNGLSEKGVEQVKKLVRFAKYRLEGKTPDFISSPKKRCIETISPVVQELSPKEPVAIDIRLGEREPNESIPLYLARIEEFIDVWKFEGAEVTVLCSHGDWIPVVVQKLTGIQIDLKKCGWIEIEYQNGECRLTWMVQKLY